MKELAQCLSALGVTMHACRSRRYSSLVGELSRSLNDAEFGGADLRGVRFSDCILKQTQFSGAKLKGRGSSRLGHRRTWNST